MALYYTVNYKNILPFRMVDPLSHDRELSLRVVLVELHQVENVIATAKEHRASFVNALRHNVENALRSGSRNTSSLIAR